MNKNEEKNVACNEICHIINISTNGQSLKLFNYVFASTLRLFLL